MDYVRIHTCVNDCILFRNEHGDLAACPRCGEARYKEGMQSNTVPRKVLRHFPVIPHLQHMFRSKGTSELLTWHATSRSHDGIMRVPADSPAWKHIETTWSDFREDPKKHSHVPSGKGALLIMDREFRAIVNNHCILNDPTMAKWVDMFTKAKARRERERDAWKRENGGR